MSSPQTGTVYRYVRVDASHDVSADPLALSLNEATPVTDGVDYIAPAAWPPEVTAADAARPAAAGFGGYWFRIFTGPGTDFPFIRGRNVVKGALTDNPETPNFAWIIHVAWDE